MEYRAVSAVVGEYGYMLLNEVNKETNLPEYSELYFTSPGLVVFLDEDNNLTSILDNRVLTQLASAHSSEVKAEWGRKSKARSHRIRSTMQTRS